MIIGPNSLLLLMNLKLSSSFSHTNHMANQHPIEPSPELVNQCMEMFRSGARFEAICRVSAQWGADQELEACCEWLDAGLRTPYVAIRLRSDRRSKPPSLKEQALAILDDCSDCLDGSHENIIRRALEELPND